MSTTVSINPTRFTKIDSTTPDVSYPHATSQTIVSYKGTSLVMQFQLPTAALEGTITGAILKFDYSGSVNVRGSITDYFSAFLPTSAISIFKTNDVATALTFSNYTSVADISSTQTLGLSAADTISGWAPDNYTAMYGYYQSGTWSQDVSGSVSNNLVNGYIGFVLSGIGEPINVAPTYPATFSNVQLVVTYEAPSAKVPSISFPANVYLKQGQPINLSWIYNSNGSATQASATVEYHDSTTSTFTVATVTGAVFNYAVPATLAQGLVTWRVKTTDTNGNVSGYATATFTIIGKPASPYVNDVANNKLTTISWNSEEQQSYRFSLYKGDTLLYEQEGADNIRSYTPNMFLDNGTYSFNIAISNMAGIWSDETQKVFVINLNKTISPIAMTITHVNNAGIRLKKGSSSQNYRDFYLKDGKVIGESNGVDYDYDYELIPGHTYQYAFRRYYVPYGDYVDGEPVSVTVDFTGIYLHGNAGTLNLQLSENTFMPLTENYGLDKKVLNYSGREYGVVELGEAKSRSITRQVTVQTREELDTLLKLYGESDLLYRDTEGNCMHVTIIDMPMTRYQDMGYTIQLVMQQINTPEVIISA